MISNCLNYFSLYFDDSKEFEQLTDTKGCRKQGSIQNLKKGKINKKVNLSRPGPGRRDKVILNI